MSHSTPLRAGLLAGCVLALAAPAATAQDLFELEVFEYESAPPGRYDVDVHTNAVSFGPVMTGPATGSHHPIHLSVEVARGWTGRVETAVFVQTAPFSTNGSPRLAGGHVRGKVQLGALRAVPLRVAASVEYAFNRPAFDDELQTLEVRSILDYTAGRLTLVANPSLEVVTRGGEGLEPVFDVSARAAWQLTGRLALAADYFSAGASTRHLRPASNAHQLVFLGAEVEAGAGWELGLSAGHCVTTSEPWVVRTTIGRRF